MLDDKFVSEVVQDLQRKEQDEFKANIEKSIRKIADIQKQINALQINLSEEKERFKQLKMQTTDFSKLIV